MSVDQKEIREHTAEEIKEGINPTFIGIEEVANIYDRYIDKDEKEK